MLPHVQFLQQPAHKFPDAQRTLYFHPMASIRQVPETQAEVRVIYFWKVW